MIVIMFVNLKNVIIKYLMLSVINKSIHVYSYLNHFFARTETTHAQHENSDPTLPNLQDVSLPFRKTVLRCILSTYISQ